MNRLERSLFLNSRNRVLRILSRFCDGGNICDRSSTSKNYSMTLSPARNARHQAMLVRHKAIERSISPHILTEVYSVRSSSCSLPRTLWLSMP